MLQVTENKRLLKHNLFPRTVCPGWLDKVLLSQRQTLQNSKGGGNQLGLWETKSGGDRQGDGILVMVGVGISDESSVRNEGQV